MKLLFVLYTLGLLLVCQHSWAMSCHRLINAPTESSEDQKVYPLTPVEKDRHRSLSLTKFFSDRAQRVSDYNSMRKKAQRLAEIQAVILNTIIQNEISHAVEVRSRKFQALPSQINQQDHISRSIVENQNLWNTIGLSQLSNNLSARNLHIVKQMKQELSANSPFIENIIEKYETVMEKMADDIEFFSQAYRQVFGVNGSDMSLHFETFQLHAHRSQLDSSQFYLIIRKLTQANLLTIESQAKGEHDKEVIKGLAENIPDFPVKEVCTIGVCTLLLNALTPGSITLAKMFSFWGAAWSPIILVGGVIPASYYSYHHLVRPIQIKINQKRLQLTLKKQFRKSTEDSLAHIENLTSITRSGVYEVVADFDILVGKIKKIDRPINADSMIEAAGLATELMLVFGANAVKPLVSPELDFQAWQTRWRELSEAGIPIQLQARDFNILSEAKKSIESRLKIAKKIKELLLTISSTMTAQKDQALSQDEIAWDFHIFSKSLADQIEYISTHEEALSQLIHSIATLAQTEQRKPQLLLELQTDFTNFIISGDILRTTLFENINLEPVE